MRFITLAVGILGLAGFTVGVASFEGPSSVIAIPSSVSTSSSTVPFSTSTTYSTSYPATPRPVSSSQYAVPPSVVKKEVSSSHYSAPTAPSLSRWHPEPSRSIPTRSIANITPLARHDEPPASLTYGLTAPCSSGSTTTHENHPTSVCTVSAPWPDTRPCATSPVDVWFCVPTTTQSADWGGRRSRWVAQAAAQSSQDFGGRRSRYVEQVAARSTQDLGGRSQRAVPHFAEATVTPAPTPVAARAAPTCSFDLSKGEYVCPKAQTALPICTFDLTKGEYVCPGHKAVREVALASPCPAGFDFCIPANEREEMAAPAPCPERVEFCVPRNEVATPTTLETMNS